MTRLLGRKGAAFPIAVLTAIAVFGVGGVAFADNIDEKIEDGGNHLTLVAGSPTTALASINLSGTGGDGDTQCNIDPGEAPLVLDIITPAGVTASPDPLSITSCGTDFLVTFTAGSGAVSGTATVAIVSTPAGGGTYDNRVGIPITVTQPAPTNTAPVVTLTGATNGASYVIGAVPATTCQVTDTQQPGIPSFNATLSGALVNGLGSQTATCSFTDAGGLSDTESVTYSIVAPPNTKPTVTVVGVTTGASYEIGAVPTPTCSISDAQDGNNSTAAVITGTLTNGLGALTATCNHTDTGGLAADTKTATYSVVDTGNPTIGHTLSPAAPNGTNGWYTSDVVVDFTCSDSGSGIASCLGDTTLGQGADQSATGTATDNAGHTATDSVTGINVDKSAPNAPTASVSPAPNVDGWNRTDVVVHFTANGDNGPSGVASCTSDVLITAETAGQAVVGTCTDNAGNPSVGTSVTVKLDGTAPVVSATVTVTGTAGTNDWYTTDVQVTFTASDALSGPSTQTGAVGSVGEGDNVAVKSPVFTDVAGNFSAVGAVTKYFKIDKTAPNAPIASLSPAPNATGWNNSDVVVHFEPAGDTGPSGVAFCTTDVTHTTETGGQVYTGFCTDNAGNVGPSESITVKLDRTAPVVEAVPVPSGTAGANGWYTSNVVATFTANDALSGPSSQTGVVTSLGEGSAVPVASPVFTDNAGNSTVLGVVTVAYAIDKTAPNAPIPSLSPTPNLAGWNTGDVVVHFAANGDGGPSGVAFCTVDVTQTTETSGQLHTGYCTDNAGNVGPTASITVKLDRTPPTVQAIPSASGTSGSNGWYTSDVAATFTANDALSGPSSQTGVVTSVGEGAAVGVASPAFTDIAGNSSAVGAVTASYKIDKSAPNAPLATVTPAANSHGWQRTDVTVSFASSGDNGPSGVADCSDDVLVTAEAADQEFTGTCTDAAGLESAGTTVTISLDKTAPVVSNTVTTTGTAGTAGWFTSDVTVTFTATDALSGPATQTGTATSTGEGAAVSVASPAFSDLADNVRAVGAVSKSYKVDKTAPSVSLVGGPSGNYYFGSLPAAPTCSASDATSGVASCVITGGGSTVGAHSYTATATDNAGNQSSVSQGYTVLNWNLSGFYQPVDMGGAWNSVKGGSTVPLKFEIFAGNAEIADVGAITSFTTKTVTCPGATTAMDEIEFITTGGTALRYSDGQFIQNWATPKKPGTCVVVTMTADDGSSISANVKLK
jgi:hypothetical protein